MKAELSFSKRKIALNIFRSKCDAVDARIVQTLQPGSLGRLVSPSRYKVEIYFRRVSLTIASIPLALVPNNMAGHGLLRIQSCEIDRLRSLLRSKICHDARHSLHLVQEIMLLLKTTSMTQDQGTSQCCDTSNLLSFPRYRCCFLTFHINDQTAKGAARAKHLLAVLGMSV